MKIEIEVEIPDGWEYVRYGFPQKGEYFLASTGNVVESDFDWRETAGPYYRRIIVRRSWQWPEWLIVPWIAMDSDGEWYAYTSKPSMTGLGYWSTPNGKSLDFDKLSQFVSIDTPFCGDWKTSLMRNPHLPDVGGS